MSSLPRILLSALLFVHVGANAEQYSFDSNLLDSSGEKIDVTIFNEGGQLPGAYLTDVYLNNEYVTTEEISFFNIKSTSNTTVLTPCLTEKFLTGFGVLTERYPNLEKNHMNNCINLDAVDGLKASMDVANQKLSISVPQIAVRKTLRGIVPESSWDTGINGLRLNYDVNVTHSSTRGAGKSNSDNAFALLQPGVNIGDWRIRNQSSIFKRSSSATELSTISSYAEKDVRLLKGTLTIGDKSTSSEIFDSFDFRGLHLGTNDRMMPYYFMQYGPVVRGIADKQIRLTVSQSGTVIYSSVIPPGPYVIDDLSVSGQAGELLVTTEDPEGNRRQYTVNWQSPAIAVRENYFRYDVVAGEYINPTPESESTKIAQVTAVYGLPADVTVYGGLRTATGYLSYTTGAGLSLGKAGSVSYDMTSTLSDEVDSVKRGETQRLRYSGLFNDSETSIIMTGAYSPSVNYRTLSDAFSGNCDYVESECNLGGLKKRFDVNYRQSFPAGVNVYTIYSVQHNHNRSGNSSRGIGLSTFIPSVGYLSADYVEYKRKDFSGFEDTDKVISASMSIPFSLKPAQNISSSWRMVSSPGNTTWDYGVNGSSLDQTLSWDISQNRNINENDKSISSYGFLSMVHQYADTELYVSGGTEWKQYGGAISGGLLLHSAGLTAGRTLGDTIALVDADGAKNVAIPNAQSVYTDSSGYAIVTSLSPYQVNSIHLDVTTLGEEDDIIQTDLNVVPTSGAIVRADFKNKSGKRILFNVHDSQGHKVKFGALAALKSTEQLTGIVDEHGQLYMSGMPDDGVVLIKRENGSCQFSYNIKADSHSPLYIINAVCV